ncbi:MULTISPECIES: Hsp20/alpha crystallin family protein [unclassified Microcystis]|jgi:HSP20 family protein|uniref:Hsp20/alpha crystallin family protein n=1 Tax=Microcystis flos-aquae Mf_QC_C_20070823_S10D TaxID=2486236 RepID=A0A552KZE6_9CHRO|nr:MULTISPECIES: Hsp20/alpha crystallin family protein [unclassified Microcystis]MCA2818271.1 Hsp20/alpha crystallin family protein [Microcystis sp. M085S1]MCA2855416.1 Hsp20/alpha crystallin family protein [Microcystis sp. M065S1]TRT91433.1 MAG: Hsp20/alpha crystallin family protein [Microcystis flos-aquae Ma_QC_C_20070823_S18D]TRV13337.1 MAG: Hsp20/alpha crystallin family protein [Microcystis flos-aquae Mf_QC_C_20070823_S10D]TRV24238.1 MAG: Hsp20/alpha crystallin family protein [Microcystis 
MAFTLYSPFLEINSVQRQIDQLFQEVLPTTSLVSRPPVEISVNEDSVELKIELPGVDIKDIDVEVSKQMVAINGQRQRPAEVENSEFYYGKFSRLITLPVEVQNSQVTANYQDGILYLTLPKAAAEKNKVVKVNLG